MVSPTRRSRRIQQKDTPMKAKTLLLASALAATGLVGAASQSASAGCGVSITVDNDESTSVSVNWAQSQVKINAFGIPATWATLGSTSSTVGADSSSTSDEVTKAFNLGFGC